MSATIDFGIDLGTTNSSIAMCRRGDVRVFQSTDLMNVTPSVVYVSKSGRILAGKKAYDTWVQDPQNTQAEFKRWMGYSDKLKFPASAREFSAEELSAEILKSLRGDAQRQTNETINAAVITVPAAFGSLQCDATARAAKLAGFEQAPLLQEPIAAAIAYGASPTARDQRWMVFDFGGGTLDIAIVSTRNSRLAVLEHQGNNRLGGKDIDRLIADAFLLAPLRSTFHLPDAQSEQRLSDRLTRALIRHAEQAKIALSTADDTTLELFDVGEDLDGKPIELTVTLRRDEMERTIQPIIEKCLDLARRALDGARLKGSDLDRILLVGGPTQMPAMRAALEQSLGAKLDTSLDPMTVVAHGAALYASTIEKTATVSDAVAPAPAPTGAVPIQLAYERASGSQLSPVGGFIDTAAGIHEVKIDSGGGVWTSGWIPVLNGAFQVDVMLHQSRPVTNFTLSARSEKGDPIRVTPAEFAITYMLPMAAPPLPHTMAIELSTSHGVTSFDPVFKRHSPLPSETRKTYKADRMLRPSDIDGTLPIKFWEIEVSDDPQEKWWAGCVLIRADRIRRPIPEGTELELTIKIDASRKMTVEVFIPLLNQSFSHEVYVPDPPGARSHLQQEVDHCFDRLELIREEMYATDRADLGERVQALTERAEMIAEQIASSAKRNADDPDASLGSTDALRKLRIQLVQVEEQMNIGSAAPTLMRKMRWQVPYIGRVIEMHGTEPEKTEFARLRGQYERYLESDDVRGIKWVQEQIWRLHNMVVDDQPWFWMSILATLKSPGTRFMNQEQAQRFIHDAENAQARGDLRALRDACNRAWVLQPPEQMETTRQQAAQSGLRAQ